MSVNDLATAAFASKNMLMSVEPKEGMWITTNTVFQGAVSPAEMAKVPKNIFKKKKTYPFIDYAPKAISTEISG